MRRAPSVVLHFDHPLVGDFQLFLSVRYCKVPEVKTKKRQSSLLSAGIVMVERKT